MHRFLLTHLVQLSGRHCSVNREYILGNINLTNIHTGFRSAYNLSDRLVKPVVSILPSIVKIALCGLLLIINS